MNCVTCNSPTTNPKFCSRSCSAKTNNRLAPKRQKGNKCHDCLIPISYGIKYCITCRPGHLGIQHKTTKREHREGLRRHTHQSSIREMARSVYKKTRRPMICQCGYSLHVDICHIKGVGKFSDDSLLSEINAPENLIALCKNCHWEFDNGYLDVLTPLQP